MNTFAQKRILALDVRPKSFAFVVFEGQTTLLDWGAKSFPGGAYAVRVPPGPKIRGLIAEYLPDALVGRRNKDQRAAAIAEQFPELLSILPPRRKIWRSEDYRMKIFDAAAVGIAYFTDTAATHRVVSPTR